jgi:DNA-damage-inducible protein J
MSAAFTIFAKKVGREKRIPFELSADPFYSRENIAELERRVADIRSGKSTLKEHELIEVK